MAKKIKILFTGGGTSGHLFPLLAVIREIRRLADNQPIVLHYIGPKDQKNQFLLTQENVKIHNIVSGKIRRYFSFENITDVLFSIPFGFLQSFFILLFNRPSLVFSKGGSGSVPVTVCANLLRIPVFLHESDTIPGQSNRVASAFAKKIFTSFEKTEYFDPTKTILVGNPILKEVMEGSKESAKEIFNLHSNKPILLFWGGSQGAEPINDFVLTILEKLLQNYEVIHVCGKKNYHSVQQEASVILHDAPILKENYHPWEFLDETPLKHALKAADLVISRAGSGSIFEIAACGKPAILIPLPSSANNHQSKNAYEYAKNGLAVIIEQENMSPNFFLQKVQYLLSNTEELEKMKNSALQFAKPLAAKAIAREILEYLHIN